MMKYSLTLNELWLPKSRGELVLEYLLLQHIKFVRKRADRILSGIFCILFSFDLSKPISIKEAIFALDYIDHDFYVFRDEETNDVSVVYKRNAGGVGLIQPEQ
jgi:hypothetical protein